MPGSGTHDRRTEAFSPELFVQWLTGDPAPRLDDFDVEAAGHAVAQCALELIRRGGKSSLGVLARLANHPDGARLLRAVLREGWAQVRDALPRQPTAKPLDETRHTTLANRSPAPIDPSGVLAYVAVGLAPNGVWALDHDELDFLVEAARYDGTLLRHLLTWAAEQPSENSSGWKVDESLPVPATMESWMAQATWWVLTRRRARWDTEFWASEEASYVLSYAIKGLDRGLLLDHALAYGVTPLVLLHELAQASVDEARDVARDARVLDDLPMPDIGRHSYTVEREVLPLLPLDVDEQYLLRIGWIVAASIHASGYPIADTAVATMLDRDVEEVTGHLVCGLSLLWANFFELADYRGKGGQEADHARSAVLARLTRHRQMWPDAWALSIHDLLIQTDQIGKETMDLIASAALEDERICAVLREIEEGHAKQETRNRAGAILARVNGLVGTDDEAKQWLADQAARTFDSTPMFPQPLTSLSRTWLGSLDLEASLAGAVRRAADRFREYARDQGAWQEEGILGRLLGCLEDAFIDANLLLRFGKKEQLQGAVSVSYRPVRKTQEKQWGCDIALLLNVDVPKAAKLDLAELVQVKKSKAFERKGAGQPHEAWEIEIPQLVSLLKKSQSSGYWLIRSSGEVLCVTARWLYGLASGHNALGQGTFVAGYNEVRHQAVPLEQYVTELMLGTWLGTSEGETLHFARGGDPAIVPRHIFEVYVVGGPRREQ